MTSTTYHVTGMTCEHCVKAVTEELTELPGVSAVTVTLVPPLMPPAAYRPPSRAASATARSCRAEVFPRIHTLRTQGLVAFVDGVHNI